MNEAIVFGVLPVALVLFITGRIRYDIVAIGALLVLTALRIIPGVRCLSWIRSSRGRNRRSRPYSQQGARKLRHNRCHGRLVFSRRQASHRTGIFAVGTGCRPVRFHEQCRRAQPDDAACHQSRKHRIASLLSLSHAPVLRFTAGWAGNSDRDTAQHHNLRFSAGSGGRIFSHVRLHAGLSAGHHLRTAVHLLRRLASHPFQATASQPVGCYRNRGLHGGSARNRKLPVRGQARPRP